LGCRRDDAYSSGGKREKLEDGLREQNFGGSPLKTVAPIAAGGLGSKSETVEDNVGDHENKENTHEEAVDDF